MASINILHASDLHIAFHDQLRSPLDKLHDLDNPWDLSGRGVQEKLAIIKDLAKSWWKKTAASSYDPQTLRALSEFIYENARKRVTAKGEVTENGEDKLDAVILTGDLATTGHEDDIKKVAKFLRAEFNPKYPHKSRESDYRGATLTAIRIPVIYLPGNHDRYVPTRRIYRWKYPRFFNPGGPNFDLELSNYRLNPVQKSELPAVEISKDKKLKVVIFTADFTLQEFGDHQGLFGWLAQGKAYSDIQQKLVEATGREIEQTGNGDVLCLLWAIHFPPDYPGEKNHSTLLDAKGLIKSANILGIKAILAGHTHQQLNYKNPSFAFEVLCCGTTTQYEPQAKIGGRHERDLLKGNHFQIITITADSTGKINIQPKHYRYSDQGGDGVFRLLSWKEAS